MNKTILHEGKYKRLVSIDGWEYVERVGCSGIVVILALTDDGKVILVEQHRVPVGKKVIEFPGGLVDDLSHCKGETFEEAAKREFLEETGYQADKMILLGRGPISAASTTDIMVTFRAVGVRKVSEGGGDHTECIAVHEVEFDKVDVWLQRKEKEGALIDPKVYAGFYLLKNHKSS